MPKLWNWGCSQKRTVVSLTQGFVPDAGGFCSLVTKAKFSLLSILWVYHVHKSLYFGFLIWLSYSFDQTTKFPLRLLFQTPCTLIFLMLISVSASMSTSLSSSQFLHKPYPILLLSGFWHLASAYFMNFIFLLVQFLVYSLSWLAPIWLVCVVSKKLENSAFFLAAPCFDTIANFLWFHFLPLSFSIYCNLSTMCLYVGITILNQY